MSPALASTGRLQFRRSSAPSLLSSTMRRSCVIGVETESSVQAPFTPSSKELPNPIAIDRNRSRSQRPKAAGPVRTPSQPLINCSSSALLTLPFPFIAFRPCKLVFSLCCKGGYRPKKERKALPSADENSDHSRLLLLGEITIPPLLVFSLFLSPFSRSCLTILAGQRTDVLLPPEGRETSSSTGHDDLVAPPLPLSLFPFPTQLPRIGPVCGLLCTLLLFSGSFPPHVFFPLWISRQVDHWQSSYILVERFM